VTTVPRPVTRLEQRLGDRMFRRASRRVALGQTSSTSRCP